MTPLIEIENLWLKYRNSDSLLFKNFNLSLTDGELIVIKGSNGSGKSTLLELIFNMAFERIITKQVDVKYGKFNVEEAASYVLQKPELQLLTFKVKEEIVTKLSFKDVNRSKRKEIGEQILRAYHMRHLAEKDPREISSGEQQKLIVLANSTTEERIILLDEPLTFLDETNIELFLDYVSDLKLQGYSLIISTHSEYFDTISDRIIWIDPSDDTQNEEYELIPQSSDISTQIQGTYGYDDPIGQIDFSYQSPGCYFILGPNGSGKTCLLMTLGGLIDEITGNLVLNGKIGILPQNPMYVFRKATVMEELSGLEIPERMQSKLELAPYQLSVGEQKFLAIYIFLQKYEVCLIDEPFQSLDKDYRNQILELIRKFKDKKTIFLTSNRDLRSLNLKVNSNQIIQLGGN